MNDQKGSNVVEYMNLEIVPMNQVQMADFAKSYRQMMLIYESGIKQVVTKFEILNNEFRAVGNRNPIESIQSRLKSPESIYAKLVKKGISVTAQNVREYLYDVAGVRVICSYVSDIYKLRDMLLSHKDIRLIREKDYISRPKPNGYRSLHLVVESMLYMADREYPVNVEIQFRTIAMDFWASLEHELRYKAGHEIPDDISQDLQECAEIIALTDRRMERIYHRIEKLETELQ